MATTENFINGDGTTTQFNFTFPYIKKEDVRIELQEFVIADNTIASTVEVTDFTIPDVNPTQVQFNAVSENNYQEATGAPKQYYADTTPNLVRIRIYRVTDTSTTASTFFVGSAIRAQDLNTNFEQALYIGQEEENKIQDVVAGGIADGSITTSKIADDAVTAAKLGNNAVTTDKIATAAVTQNRLSNNSVRTAKIQDGNVTALKIESPLSGDLTFAASQTYPKIPANTQTATYTLVASDAGKHINITTGGVTVPSGVFDVGDVISIYNNNSPNTSPNDQTITQGGSVTLRQAGTANTGNRTLAQYGLATILCVAANDFVITGTGLT